MQRSRLSLPLVGLPLSAALLCECFTKHSTVVVTMTIASTTTTSSNSNISNTQQQQQWQLWLQAARPFAPYFPCFPSPPAPSCLLSVCLDMGTFCCALPSICWSVIMPHHCQSAWTTLPAAACRMPSAVPSCPAITSFTLLSSSACATFSSSLFYVAGNPVETLPCHSRCCCCCSCFFDLLLLSYLCIIEFCLKSDRQPLPLLAAQQQLLPLSHNYD